MTKKTSAGDTIDARCTRCRATMNHTIIAMVEERVARVKCNTCGGEHNYKPEAKPKATAAKKAAAPKTPKATKAAADNARKEWESLREEMNPEKAIPYRMDGTFKTNDLVSHPTFGLGIVKSVPGAMKMEVLFEGGVKLLRCR